MIVKIVDGKIENFFEQLGVDVPQPQFSWAFAGTGYDECQTKYRLMVAQTEQNLHSGVHLHYDSGIVESDNTIAITYEGVPLDDVTKYYWKVQVWDQSDTQLESEVYSFVTGKIADPWTGQWIGNGTAKPFYARKSYAFTKEIQEAYAFVCGLGQFIFYINGNKVGDHELDPGWTNYHKIIQYVTFDITELLTDGANVFGMEVANGWYVPDEGGKYYVQTPKIKWISTLSDRFQDGGDGKRVFANILSALAEIHIIYTDGTRAVIGTDASWKTRESPTRLANVFGSEVYDARCYPSGWCESTYDTSNWQDAIMLMKADKPKGMLMAQSQPPVHVKQIYEPVSVKYMMGGLLCDLGQNMAGMIEMSVRGKAGQTIRLRPAEKLDDNGMIDQRIADFLIVEFRDLDVECTYILSGHEMGETWKQEFSYFGGRYIFLEGVTNDPHVTNLPYLQSLKAHYITSKSPMVGTFSCSDERINAVYRLVTEAIDSNLQHVHTDCPTLEKIAWLEISHLMAPSIMFYKDVNTLWNKIFADIRSEQYAQNDFDNGSNGKPHYRGDGFIPSRAPNYVMMVFDSFIGDAWDVPTWGSTIIIGVAWHYVFYGKKQVIADNYEATKRYVAYLKTKLTDDGFLNHGLGDWGNPDFGSLAKSNIETAIYYHDLALLSRFATILEHETDAAFFRQEAHAVLANYNQQLLVKNDVTGLWGYKAAPDPKLMMRLSAGINRLTGKTKYTGGLNMIQACQALPLYFGMVPPDKIADVQKSLELVLDERGFVCGEVSLPYVLQTLKAMGDSQRIFEFVTRDEHPSYYRFVVQGETTLPEFWTDTARSRNHDMLGHIVEWFYNGMAGIASQNDAFKEISICPSLPNGVDRLQCGYQSVRGYIEVTVDRDDTGSTVHITLPPNTSAAVDLSKIDSRLTHAYIEQLDVQTDVSMLSLSSGTYTILLSQLNSLCR